MSSSQTAAANGVNGETRSAPVSTRFTDIPSAIDIPVQGDQEDEAVEIDLEDLVDDPTELCTLFENERAAKTYWMTVALAYAKQHKIDHAIEMLQRGGSAIQSNSSNPRDKVSMICCLCWMYLWKSREAPRVAPEGTSVSEAKTKEYYLQLATSSLNDAARLNPSFPPIFLARGVLLLLRASLQAPSKTTGGIGSEKHELLKTAVKSFDDALRVSQGKNMLALMGKARALFSMHKYPESR
jgi:RNA polymerase-associated protein CTR9